MVSLQNFGKYIKMFNLQPNVVSYFQSRVIKKTLKNISFDYRRLNEEGGREIDVLMFSCQDSLLTEKKYQYVLRNKEKIFTKLCIIGCKIIHVYSPTDADNKLLEVTMNARHKFGVDVWTSTIRQAVERMTESELFLPILQKGYGFMANKDADFLPFINFIDLSLNNFLAGELKLSQQKLLNTKDLYNETFINRISKSLSPSGWTKFQFSSSIINGWHNSKPVEHIKPFKRLCVVKEIMYQKIFRSAELFTTINDRAVTESELALYEKLQCYLKEDKIALWEAYASNEPVCGIAMDLTSIMLENHRANMFIKIFNKNLQKDDIIVCLYNEYRILYEMERITIGRMQIDMWPRCHESILNDAIKALSESEYKNNSTKFKYSRAWDNNKLLLVLEKRYSHHDLYVAINKEVLGNLVEQKLWLDIHQKMKEMFMNAFKPINNE